MKNYFNLLRLVSYIISENRKKELNFVLKYTEFKEFLQKHPYCFTPIREKQKEFDRRVASAEKRPIVFANKEGTDIKG